MVGGIPVRWQDVWTEPWHVGASLIPFPLTSLGLYGCPFSSVLTMKRLPPTPSFDNAATTSVPNTSSVAVGS
jgi:hypothetical protein